MEIESRSGILAKVAHLDEQIHHLRELNRKESNDHRHILDVDLFRQKKIDGLILERDKLYYSYLLLLRENKTETPGVSG